jgi:hypothetical protein
MEASPDYLPVTGSKGLFSGGSFLVGVFVEAVMWRLLAVLFAFWQASV